jgi:hypothetical protein
LIVLFSSLSPARQRLIRYMHQIQFGRIHNLLIVDGEPQLSQDNKAQKRRRMKNQTVGELLADDFALKEEQLQLFDTFDEIKNGINAIFF